MGELAAFFPQSVVGYTQMCTITTDDLIGSNELRQSTNAWWTFMHDPGRKVQKDLDIQEYTDPRNDPVIPHTIVLAPGLVIHKVYTGYWFWGRPSTHELHMDLREITREIRPDWDIQTPEWRARWERGERDLFWPYGQSIASALAQMSYATDQLVGESAEHVHRENCMTGVVGPDGEK